MCRVTVLFGTSNEKVTKEQCAKQLLMNGMKHNQDGYFIKAGAASLRTLDKAQYVRYFNKKQSVIASAPMVFMHQRTSTNKVSQEFVHGWRLEQYYCAHNGVGSHIPSIATGNDSLDLFSSIDTDSADAVKAAYVRNGDGTYFMLDERGSGYIFGETIYVAVPDANHELWAFSSKEDVFNNKYEYVTEKLVKAIGVINIVEKEHQKLSFPTWTAIELRDTLLVLKAGVPIREERLPQVTNYSTLHNVHVGYTEYAGRGIVRQNTIYEGE